MGHSLTNTLKNIINADSSTLRFVDEWLNESPFIVAHTSGSTGKPKEIQLLKSDMIESATETCRFFNINNNSTLVSPLSADYIAGKMMIVRAIVSGAKLYVEQPSNQPLKLDYGEIDLMPLVPSQIDWLLSGCKYISNIRNLIIGGGALSPTKERELINRGLNAYATYGMTETCSHIALRHISSQLYHTLPHITVATDYRDCLVINSPRFSFKSIVTNDIVELVDSTRFKWIGRFDNVINSGGIKLFPETIEQKLASVISCPFYIVGEPDDHWGEIVSLYIETGYIDKEDILNKATSLLDKYSIPKKITCVQQFYRTESGKIKRIIHKKS